MVDAEIQKQFQEHPVREKLRAVAVQFAEWKQTQTFSDATSNYRAQRAASIFDFMVGALEGADVMLTGTEVLSAISPHVDQALSVIAQLRAGNAGVFKQAWQQAEQMFAHVPKIVSNRHGEAIEAYGNVVARLQAEQSNILQAATVKAAETAAQASALGTNIATLQTTIEQLQSQIGQQSQRLDAALNAFATSSATAEAQRETRYQEWVTKQADAFVTRANEEVAKVTMLLTTTETAAKDGLTSLDNSRNEAAKTLGVIGNIAVTGDYKGSANSNEETANSLRKGAVGLFLAMVVVVAYIVWNGMHDGFSWEVAAFRYVSALVLVVPAFYLARESARHREVSERMRRTELELASLDAFLALLEKPERDKIKAELARKYFGNMNSERPLDAKAPEMPLTLREFLDHVTAMVKAIKK